MKSYNLAEFCVLIGCLIITSQAPAVVDDWNSEYFKATNLEVRSLCFSLPDDRDKLSCLNYLLSDQSLDKLFANQTPAEAFNDWTEFRTDELQQEEMRRQAALEAQRLAQLAAAPRSSDEDLLNICDSEFGSDETEIECFKSARSGNLSANQIKACGDGFNGDTAELQCIDLVGKLQISKSTIDACGKELQETMPLLHCLEVVHLNNLSHDYIKECADAMDGDEDEARCISHSYARQISPQIIAACGKAMGSNPYTFFCIDTAAETQPTVDNIENCDRVMNSDHA